MSFFERILISIAAGQLVAGFYLRSTLQVNPVVCKECVGRKDSERSPARQDPRSSLPQCEPTFRFVLKIDNNCEFAFSPYAVVVVPENTFPDRYDILLANVLSCGGRATSQTDHRENIPCNGNSGAVGVVYNTAVKISNKAIDAAQGIAGTVFNVGAGAAAGLSSATSSILGITSVPPVVGTSGSGTKQGA